MKVIEMQFAASAPDRKEFRSGAPDGGAYKFLSGPFPRSHISPVVRRPAAISYDHVTDR